MRDAALTGGGDESPMVSDDFRPTVEVRLLGSFRRYLKGKTFLKIEAREIRDILRDLPLDRGEVGLVLVNKRAVESAWTVRHPLDDGDLVEIYPIVTGG